MTLVVDACVALKWLVSEEHEASALHVRAYNRPHVAPSHFVVEVAAALRKKLRVGDVQASALPELLALVSTLPVAEQPVGRLLSQAMDIAVAFQRSIYDAFYVALARQLNCQFVTADRKLYDALASAYPETMLWIEDVPAP